jgi:hypothetical protein
MLHEVLGDKSEASCAGSGRAALTLVALTDRNDLDDQLFGTFGMDVRFVPEADIDLHSRSGRSRRTPIP